MKKIERPELLKRYYDEVINQSGMMDPFETLEEDHLISIQNTLGFAIFQLHETMKDFLKGMNFVPRFFAERIKIGTIKPKHTK